MVPSLAQRVRPELPEQLESLVPPEPSHLT